MAREALPVLMLMIVLAGCVAPAAAPAPAAEARVLAQRVGDETVNATAETLRFVAPGGASWGAASLVPDEDDWTQDGEWWKIRLDLALDGVPADRLAALSVIFVEDGLLHHDFPMFGEGETGASIWMGFSWRPENASFLVVPRVQEPSPGFVLRAAFTGEGEALDAIGTDRAWLDAGDGTQLSLHYAFDDPLHGAQSFTHNVEVNDTREGETPMGAGARRTWSATIRHEVAAPSLFSAMMGASTDVGSSTHETETRMDDRSGVGRGEGVRLLGAGTYRNTGGSAPAPFGRIEQVGMLRETVQMHPYWGHSAWASGASAPFDPTAHGFRLTGSGSAAPGVEGPAALLQTPDACRGLHADGLRLLGACDVGLRFSAPAKAS